MADCESEKNLYAAWNQTLQESSTRITTFGAQLQLGRDMGEVVKHLFPTSKIEIENFGVSRKKCLN